MISRNETAQFNSLLTISLLIAILTSLPLVLIFPKGSLPYVFEITLFSIESISCLSLVIILLNQKFLLALYKQHPPAATAFIIILAIEYLQMAAMPNYHLNDFLSSTVIFTVPMATYLCSPHVKNLIVPYISLLWLINIFHSYWQMRMGQECIGITGNKNWNAILILASLPFVALLTFNYLKKHPQTLKYAVALSSIPIILSIAPFIRCNSRGATLSLIFIILILILLYSYNYSKKIFLGIIIGGFLVILVSTLLYGDLLAGIIFKDVRFSLWHSTFRLFIDNPLLGVSFPGFESAYASYRPIDYFIKEHHFAFRTIHPHNEFLYVLASLGIFGALAWLALWIYPLYKILTVFRKIDIVVAACAVSLSILIFHSMFDLVLFQWPTMYLACILLGIIWSEVWPIQPIPDFINNYASSYLAYVTAVLLFFILVYSVVLNLNFSNKLRNSEISMYSNNDPAAALSYCDRAIMIKNNPVLLFNSGVLSLKLFNDPEMSMFFFNKMQNSISPQIAHSNRYIAECLISAGKLNEALIFCRKDSSNFPISVISLYMQLSLENQLGKKKESDISSEKLLNALKHMGLKEKHIPEILKNPYYEHKFVELRNKGE